MNYHFDHVVDRHGTDSLKWDSDSSDVLPMWVADMDFPAAPQIRDALAKRAEHGIYGYGKVPSEYFEAAVSWESRRYGWNLKAGWCSHSPGIVAGLHFVIKSMLAPGEKVIMLTPVYYPFFVAAQKNGVEVIKSPLLRNGGRYYIDFEDFEKKVSDRTVKLFMLCSPHNPGGRVWSRSELVRLAEICDKYDVLIVSDEIHCDLCLGSSRHVPIASLGESISNRCITFIAPSKTFNLAGLQTSVAIIENPGLKKKFDDFVLSVGISRPNIFGIAAMRAAYTECDDWLEEVTKYIQGNVEYLLQYGKDHFPELHFMKPDAGYLVWFDFSELKIDSEEFHKLLLEKGKIWLDEGYLFGREGIGFERINVACPRSVLEEGMKRVAKTVNYVKTGH